MLNTHTHWRLLSLFVLLWSGFGCTVHECRPELITNAQAARDSSPCGNADSTELVDTEDEYYYNCEWHCVQYSGECQRVWITFGYIGGWVQNPEVETDTCKTKD